MLIAAAAAAPAGARERVPLPRGVTVVTAACPGYEWALGCYLERDHRVYVRQAGDRLTRYHELGHAWIDQTLTPADQQWLARLAGAPRGMAWAAGPGERSGEELVAEAYAYCALGWGERSGRGRWGEESPYGYQPRPRRHRTICNAISLLGLVRR